MICRGHMRRSARHVAAKQELDALYVKLYEMQVYAAAMGSI